MALHRSAPDPELLTLFEESGRNVQRSALLLRDLLSDYPEQAGLARDIVLCEQVQRGLRSRAYDSGRFSALRENGVYHFQNLVREFLAEDADR